MVIVSGIRGGRPSGVRVRAVRVWAVVLLLSLVAGGAATAPAAAEEAAAPPGSPGGRDGRVTVRVEGRPVFRLGSRGEESAAGRAAKVERRIGALRERPEAIAPVVNEAGGPTGDGRVLSVSGVPLVTVTPEDAQDNLTDVGALSLQWARALDRELSRAKERRQTAWGRFRSEVQAAVETAFSRLGESAVTVIPRLLAAGMVLGLFWLLASGLRLLMRVVFRRAVSDLTLENLIKQVVYYSVWVVGLIVSADALGWDPRATATGLGLTGLALGFALKDILSNFVSGLILLASRPFEVGDQIVVGATEGGVVRIMLRATKIRTYDGREVLVPNAEVFTSRITNNTASPVRRGCVVFPLGYDQDPEAAVRAMRVAAESTPGVLAEPPPSVRVANLGAGAIDLEVRFWTDSRRSDFIATQSAVRRAVVRCMRQAGVGLPNPDLRLLAPQDVATWREVTRAAGAPATPHGRGRPGMDGGGRPDSTHIPSGEDGPRHEAGR